MHSSGEEEQTRQFVAQASLGLWEWQEGGQAWAQGLELNLVFNDLTLLIFFFFCFKTKAFAHLRDQFPSVCLWLP